VCGAGAGGAAGSGRQQNGNKGAARSAGAATGGGSAAGNGGGGGLRTPQARRNGLLQLQPSGGVLQRQAGAAKTRTATCTRTAATGGMPAPGSTV
jgi:hypothetical protein